MRLLPSPLWLGLALLVGGAASARGALLVHLNFISPNYLGWAVESIDSPSSEAGLISTLWTLSPGASGPVADHNQIETAYRSSNPFTAPSFLPEFSWREEDSGDVYDTFSLAGIRFVVAKFGAGLKDPRTITSYTSGRNPRPRYAPSTHVWFFEAAGTGPLEARVPSTLRGLSHVSTFGGFAPFAASAAAVEVPEGGMTALLLGGALGGLFLLFRRRA